MKIHSWGQSGWLGRKAREGRSPSHTDSLRHRAAAQPGLPAEPRCWGGRPEGPAEHGAQWDSPTAGLQSSGGWGNQKGKAATELCFTLSTEGPETFASLSCRSCYERGGQSGYVGPLLAAGAQDA